jgi:hypothetical protein
VQVFVGRELIQAIFHLLALTPKWVQLLDQKFFSLPKDKLPMAKAGVATSKAVINKINCNLVGLADGITFSNFLLNTLG